MFQKLKQKKGETLIEVLVSLMIALICMGILTLSVTTAARLNIEIQRLNEEYSTDLQKAEGHLAPITGTPCVGIKIDEDGNGTVEPAEIKTIDITLYGAGDDASFVSYK